MLISEINVFLSHVPVKLGKTLALSLKFGRALESEDLGESNQ